LHILGISAYYHDSAAALITDGEIIAAAQEERFSRKKHDPEFPAYAINSCLRQAGISYTDLDYVAFYDKPFLKFERILETYLHYAPMGIQSFLKAMPLWMKKKLWIKSLIEEQMKDFKGEILFPEHHFSHAASAFYPSPYPEAAIITVDGVGEWTTTSIAHGQDNRIDILKEIHFPHSLGMLYSAFTYYTGFKVNSGEYKVMGLAPYGEAKYVQMILDHLIDVKEDGSFRLNMDYFNYAAGLTMTNKKFAKLFGGPPRTKESDLTQRDMDLARSVQDVVEDVMLRMTRHVKKLTNSDYLCLAGGVALNCVANGKILRENLFRDIWIQPAAGDAGGALGAALAVWYGHLKKLRITNYELQNEIGDGQLAIGNETVESSQLSVDSETISDLKAPGSRPQAQGSRPKDPVSSIQHPETNPKLEEMSNVEYRMSNDEVQKSKINIQYSTFKDLQKGSYLGPEFSNNEILEFLDANSIPHQKLDDNALHKTTAKLLANINVVGWFNGPMEFGPRALGGRSILGDARSPEMQKEMNLKIKFRESFRPFAPAVLAEEVENYFEIDRQSPYMLLVADVKKGLQRKMTPEEQKLSGIDKLNISRSQIPAITHVDYSARIQTVHQETNPGFHRLLSEFNKITGCPVLINTSFNVRGEPIVCTPEDAYKCFMRTNMDYLVLGNFLLDKKDQPAFHDSIDWREEFELD
jgi:carbamoyltransferase